MSAITLQQIQETACWKRTLFFMKEETIILKNRIAEIVKGTIDTSSLAEIEKFQSSFINEDVLIGLFRNDLAELDQLFKDETGKTKKNKIEINSMLVKLRNNFEIAEKRFSKLKSDFNGYASGLINQLG